MKPKVRTVLIAAGLLVLAAAVIPALLTLKVTVELPPAAKTGATGGR